MIAVDRRAFIGLCRASNGLVAGCVARHPVIDPAWVKTHMHPQGKATFLYCIGGGDESITFTRWLIPTEDGVVTRVMPMTLHRLWQLEPKKRYQS